ncbi:MAG: hypothetical protein GY715_13625 [Planctomycetes bacterium]|nr:hypothetical protein [Planctomycetota bacterium]
MSVKSIARLTVVGGLFVTACTLGRPAAGADASPIIEASPIIAHHSAITLEDTSSRVNAFVRDGRIVRLYGETFAQGASPHDTVDGFLARHADVLNNLDRADLVPAPMNAEGGNALPLMYDAATETYKFTALYYDQQRDGVPVWGSRLVLLVRNEPGFPLVLVNPDTRNLGQFRVNDPQAAGAAPVQIVGEQVAQVRFGPNAVVDATRQVIYAGQGDDAFPPRLAEEMKVRIGADYQMLITDAATGAILYEEQLICFQNVNGTAEGLASEGIGADLCENEVATPLPYLFVEVQSQGQSAFSDANGNFTIPLLLEVNVDVTAGLNGMWFDVSDFFNNEEIVTDTVLPPGPASLLFNSANNESERAQVNAYVEANRVRDYVLAYSPAYPTLQNLDFPVSVNRTDGFCPANAWYDPGEESINFCQSASGIPNTAWSSVIHHEYGHHLVNAAGSGQGAYGEGTGDVISVLVLDAHELGVGWANNCSGSLRDAENDCQYQVSGCSSCGSAIHSCGQLLSGCVWDLRNQLLVSNPGTYRDILSNLAINAILLHSGSSIDPSITVDYLTLDDDNGNIFDGTPHYTQINTAFSLHNMDGPELSLLAFTFPSGLPDLVNSSGSTTVRVEVNGVTGSPEPGTGTFYVDDGGGLQTIPMAVVSPNVYDATFPPASCGASISYYFSAETTTSATQFHPVGAPTNTLSAIAADSSTAVFDDDGETDPGWTVSGVVDDGAWNRGVPAGGGDRGDPGTDADGSGQCWLTDNVDGNSDVDGGTTILTSPILDATGDGTYITYSRWYSNTNGSNPNSDIFEVEVSDNGGSTWTDLETVGPAGAEADGGWNSRTYRVADIVGTANDQFRIRFMASDLGTGSVVEAGVDAVKIEQFECGGVPCAEDLDGSGDVGFGDILTIIGAWGPCGVPCPEDLSGNGNVDFADILAVIAAFGSCP